MAIFMQFFLNRFDVLIETYWNVNEEQKEWLKFLHTVLIETYWNVNLVLQKFTIIRKMGINRNILECKFKYGQFSSTNALAY